MEHYLIPRKIALPSAIFFLLLIIINVTGVVRIGTLEGVLPVFCPFKAIAGIDCPGCGMVRAMTSLIDGCPGNAALYNPFCFFLLFIILVSTLPERWMRRIRIHVRVLPALYCVVLSLLLTYWVFDRLLPHIN